MPNGPFQRFRRFLAELKRRKVLEPFDNLLLFAEWPILAGCLALFLLRDEDTMWSLDEALRSGDSSGGRAATRSP